MARCGVAGIHVCVDARFWRVLACTDRIEPAFARSSVVGFGGRMTLARSIALVALLTPSLAFAQDAGTEAPTAAEPAASTATEPEAPAPSTFESYAQSNAPTPGSSSGEGSSADWRRISEAELL